jgi:transcriptional regulator with XRE-family HTH domain
MRTALLAEIRRKGFTSNKAFGEACGGVSLHAIGRLLRGQTDPSPSLLAAILAALEVPESDADRLMAKAWPHKGGRIDLSRADVPAVVTALRRFSGDLSTDEMAGIAAAICGVL